MEPGFGVGRKPRQHPSRLFGTASWRALRPLVAGWGARSLAFVRRSRFELLSAFILTRKCHVSQGARFARESTNVTITKLLRAALKAPASFESAAFL